MNQAGCISAAFEFPLKGYSLLITHYSLLITHYSLLITHYSLLITHYSLLKGGMLHAN